MRGPLTQPLTSTTLPFLRRRRRLRFVLAAAGSFSEEVELVGDNGEGAEVRESLRGLAFNSESSSGLGSGSSCIVPGPSSPSWWKRDGSSMEE